MKDMKAFKNQLIISIKQNSKLEDGNTREYYENCIASWILKQYLTTTEADECLAVLNEYYPAPEEETEETE